MKRIRMLVDHDGAREGDVVGVESDARADALVAEGKARHVRFVHHNPNDHDEGGQYVDVEAQE